MEDVNKVCVCKLKGWIETNVNITGKRATLAAMRV
jgi:hypothetical protein